MGEKDLLSHSGQSETPPRLHDNQGETVTAGVRKYHFDTSELPETELPEIDGFYADDMLDGDVLGNKAEWDDFIRTNIGSAEELSRLHRTWVVAYEEGEDLELHQDFSTATRIKTVVVTVKGEATLEFPGSEDIHVTVGDILVFDGMINPKHRVRVITDRTVLLFDYEY